MVPPDANSRWRYPSGSQVLMPLAPVTPLPEAIPGLCLLLHRIMMAEGLPCGSVRTHGRLALETAHTCAQRGLVRNKDTATPWNAM